MSEIVYNDLDLEGDLDESGKATKRDRLVIKREDGENRSFPITPGLAKKIKPITEQTKPRLLTEADPEHGRL